MPSIVRDRIVRSFGKEAFSVSFYNHFNFDIPVKALPGSEHRAVHQNNVVGYSELYLEENRTEEKKREKPTDVAWHVIVPQLLRDSFGGTTTITVATRNSMWTEVFDASHLAPLLSIPVRLIDAWTTTPRSREDLNALEDNHEAAYYYAARKDDKKLLRAFLEA